MVLYYNKNRGGGMELGSQRYKYDTMQATGQ